MKEKKPYLAKTFELLKNTVFTRVYLAETIALLGDAFTWVGLALVAYELSPQGSATILSIALTLRVAVYFVVAPAAGVLADRYNKKKIMVFCHILRMIIVAALPFITAVWQIYVLVFLLNFFNAVFTPAYKAALAGSVKKEDFPKANALSSSTYQLLGMLGPGIAGSVAGLIGARQIFFINAGTFLIAAILIFILPYRLIKKTSSEEKISWRTVKKGTVTLFGNAQIKLAVMMNMVSAFAGAQVLINTVGYVKGTLKLGDMQYGWVMSGLGVGAVLSAFLTGRLAEKFRNINLIIIGALIAGIAIVPASFATLIPLIALWFMAGLGQNLVENPAQNIIVDNIDESERGRVFGAHFAWTHLWWVMAYPLAGLFNKWFNEKAFFYGGILCLIMYLIYFLLFYRNKKFKQANGEKISKNES